MKILPDTMHPRKTLALLALLVSAGTLAACSDDGPTGVVPDPPAPAEIVIEPETVTLTSIGATHTLEVVVLDEEGEPMDEVEVTFTSSDEAVATVDAEGVVTGQAEGTAVITAAVGEITAEVTVQVTVDEGNGGEG